jgi:type IV pilus assembly protein PilY1
MVDSSPVVLDIFADLDNDGIREWHTVLVASAGGTNRELFALDITNPLAPTMLWDIESSYDNVSLPYAPVVLMDDNSGQGNVATAQAFRWRNHCRASEVSAGTCTAASFSLPPATDSGRSTTGQFNYKRLGASQSVQAALMRRNNDPVFAAFIASNEPGGNGMNVFAIDIANGRKIWEFNNPYDKNTDAASSDHSKMADALDNSAPQGTTLYSKANTTLVDTLYVGDLEGSLWEVDVADGLNLTSYANQLGGSTCTADGWCNFPLSNAFWYDPSAYPQPITTLSTIFAIPQGLPSTSPFASYGGNPFLAYGTAGTDAVSSLSYTVTGSMHLFPLTYSGRLQANDILGPPVSVSIPKTKGLAKEFAGYPQYVTTGERLYGSIVAAGDHLYFATTKGTVTNIDSRGSLSGSTYGVDLGAAAGSSRTTLTSTAGGAGGTVLVGKTTSGQIRVVTVTDQTINVSAPQTVNLTAPPINGQTPTAFLGWFFKAMGHEY